MICLTAAVYCCFQLSLCLAGPIELELELDASVDPSHPTDDNGEASQSLYISPFVSKTAI